MILPIVFLLVLISQSNGVDLQFHDTYIVVSPFYLSVLLLLFSGMISGIYWLARSRN